VHDPRAVVPLITLLQIPHLEPLLTVACIRALSSFPEQRVVAPLLDVLSNTNPLIYEEAIDALGVLGTVALDSLIAALDSEQSSILMLRIQRAILVMTPFPGEVLVAALEHCSETQAYQILEIFKKQGTEAARILVGHLLHKDEQVRDYIYQTLNDMPGPLVVPALLEVLNQPTMRRVVTMLLLQYPEAATSPLVDLLGDHERGDVAAALLPLFGPQMLVPLVSGLDNQRSAARERAQRIIVALVRQSEQPLEILHEIVDLFYPPPPAPAREMLLVVLTHELADVSLPALLEGLEDAHLINDVSNAFVLLSRQPAYQNTVLDYLIDALSLEERRRGATTALVKIGTPAVPRVGALITSQSETVAKAAKSILRDMGVPALSFIWTAHSDSSNAARRNAALEVFHSMRPEAIRDELMALLVSDKPGDTAMAVALLLERMHDEVKMGYADRVLIPDLIEHVRVHGTDNANLRVLALLLLLGEHAIIDHLIQTLDEHPQHSKQLTYALLLFSSKTQQLLLDVFQDEDASLELRTEIAAVLGMMSAPDLVTDYAQNISTYGMSATRTSVLFPDQMAIGLRALGGLLASGYWNVRKLQELRDACQQGNPSRELFNVLLGMRYEPQIAQLRHDLQDERDAHKKEIYALTARIVGDQKRIQNLEGELEEVRREHGFRGDELHQTRREKEVLNRNLDQAMQEKDIMQSDFERVLQERDALHNDLNRVLKDRDALEAELQSMSEENKSLYKQNQDLIWQLNHPDRTR